MIVHLAPRRFGVLSPGYGPQAQFPIELDTLVGVDLEPAPEKGVLLRLRTTDGRRVVAGSYASMSEAGPDCGRLRILAGLPAWTTPEIRSGGTPADHRRAPGSVWLTLLACLTALALWSAGRVIAPSPASVYSAAEKLLDTIDPMPGR